MEKLSHAYIVSSASEEEGLKQAVTLASEMLCSGMGKKPCGVCRDCRKIKAGVHPDLGFVRRSLDDKGNKKRDIQVDQIRDMGADAYVLPNEANGKVYIIEEAETMNESAQNAALKLFEEPPDGVHFILARLIPKSFSRPCARGAYSLDATQEASRKTPKWQLLQMSIFALCKTVIPPNLRRGALQMRSLTREKCPSFWRPSSADSYKCSDIPMQERSS